MELLIETSVKVSWNQFIANEIKEYTVYYRPSDSLESKSLVIVSSSESSVVIEDLVTNVVYQFQVAATAELGGETYLGELSSPILLLLTTTHPNSTPENAGESYFMKYNS